MGSEWPLEKIGRHADVFSGFAFKSADLRDNDGIPVVKIKNVKNKVVDISETQFFPSDLITNKHDKFWLQHGDVLIAMTGQGSVGRVGRLSLPASKQVLLNQRVGKFLPSPTLDLRYLYYVASWNYYEDIFFNAGIGSGQPNLSPDDIKNIEIPIPPLNTQKTIAHILGTLDDKIELNRRMNATLEAMAQALFKSWFVDFDPVIDKAQAAGHSIPEPLQKRAQARQALGEKRKPLPEDIARHFPSRFVFTEKMGWVPEGWEVKTIGDEYNVVMGQSPKGDTYNEAGNGTLFYQGRAEFGWRFPKPRLYTTDPKRMANAGDSLMSVRAPVGDFNIALNDCCIGRGLCALRHGSGSSSFTYYQMKDFQKSLDKFNGEGTVFGSINQKDLKAQSCLAPAEETVNAFISSVENMDSQIFYNSNQVLALTKLRDILLPKLLSGTIRIPPVEKRMKETDVAQDK